MSPVFRHGRLRLYLLKLLDEAPRHGYEVIRLLQDRFMGVYAPSPGTIYPRLARLEEDGLVTHEEVGGKKVYSITDKGRDEIRARLGDLADLEDELTESLRDVAREISVDVRDTVRSIREELASAARDFRIQDGGKGDRPMGSGDRAKGSKAAADDGSSVPRADRSDEARHTKEGARRTREQMRADFRAQSRARSDWTSRSDWAGWSAWSEWAGGKDWAGGGFAGDTSGARGDTARGDTAPGGTGQRAGPRSRRGGPNPFSDLERIAIQFANELRATAKQTGNLGERSLNDLRDILTDTLAKVRAEVFGEAGSAGKPSDPEGEAVHDQPAASAPRDAAADHVEQANEGGPDHTDETR